jgi:hypothetical protein
MSRMDRGQIYWIRNAAPTVPSFIVMPVQVYGPRPEAPNLDKAHPHREAVTSDAYEGDDSDYDDDAFYCSVEC